MGLEAVASVIRTYQIQLVPGLLQTEGYAGALSGRVPRPRRGDRVAKRAAGEPPEILRRPDAPQLLGRGRRGRAAPPGRRPGVVGEQLKTSSRRRMTSPYAAGPAIQRRCALGDGRPVQHPAVRRARPAERRLRRAADRRDLPGKPVEVDSYHEVMEQLCLQAKPAAVPKIISDVLAEI